MGFEQMGQREALFHPLLRDAEAVGDLLDPQAVIGQAPERLALVERLHRQALDVFRQRDRRRPRRIQIDDLASRLGRSIRPFLGQPAQGQQPPLAGHHLVAVLPGLPDAPHHQGLNQAVRAEVGDQAVQVLVGPVRADVGGGNVQLIEGQLGEARRVGRTRKTGTGGGLFRGFRAREIHRMLLRPQGAAWVVGVKETVGWVSIHSSNLSIAQPCGGSFGFQSFAARRQ